MARFFSWAARYPETCAVVVLRTSKTGAQTAGLSPFVPLSLSDLCELWKSGTLRIPRREGFGVRFPLFLTKRLRLLFLSPEGEGQKP
jgi:hypothetical protein